MFINNKYQTKEHIPSIRFSGSILNALAAKFPKFAFTSGLDMSTGRYGIFVHMHKEPGSNLPAVGDRGIFIETSGSSDADMEVLFTKVLLMHG